MCTHILRVSFKAQGEPAQLLAFDDIDAMNSRLEDLLKLDTVSTIRHFSLMAVYSRYETWARETL